jgi:hypothetical protein
MDEIASVKQSGMSWRDYQRKRSLTSLFDQAERSKLHCLYEEAPESTPDEVMVKGELLPQVSSYEDTKRLSYTQECPLRRRLKTKLREQKRTDWPTEASVLWHTDWPNRPSQNARAV